MAAHSKVGRQSDQRDRYGAQGQDQEQPDHPHDVLGYQKELECAWEAWGRCRGPEREEPRSGEKNIAQGVSPGS
jgi:hypothetical protein